MCGICTFKMLESCNTITQKPINFGVIDDAMFIALWSEKDDKGKHAITSTLETSSGENIVSITIEMNYCPNCGRKLTT